MVLEATMICVDNSDWMRNGDLSPTRLDAQADAVNLTANRKLNDNPESTVGLMTIGGKREVLVTLNRDMGKILSMLHRVKIGGSVDLLAGIQIAQLVLKHRQSKNHRQRIIAFVGSPLEASEKELKKLAGKLKKNNVAIDVVSFGEVDENQGKLEAFVAAANKDDNSRLLTVHAGSELTDVLLSHPILCGDEPPTESFPFGVDPSVDPELAMALRLSAEEERQRQAQAEGGSGGGDAAPASGGGDAAAPPSGAGAAPMDVGYDDDPELRAALMLSLQEAQQAGQSSEGSSGAAAAASQPAPMDTGADENEDEQIRRALQMSMGGDKPAEKKEEAAAASGSDDAAAALQDPSFFQNVLSQLPGVDPSDPSIQEMLAAMGGQDKEQDKEKKKEDKDDGKSS